MADGDNPDEEFIPIVNEPKYTTGPDHAIFYASTTGPDRDSVGGRLLRGLRSLPRFEELPERGGDMYDQFAEAERNREPGSDTPQQWSRRGLSEHIRLELQVLGILPLNCGRIHKDGKSCEESHPESFDRDRIESDDYWTHFCKTLGGEEILFTPDRDLCERCNAKRPGPVRESPVLPVLPEGSGRWADLEFGRPQFEGLLGFELENWQWDWVLHYGRGERLVPHGRRGQYRWVPRESGD